MAPPRLVFAKDLTATIGRGMTSAAAGRILGVTERTIRRAAHRYGVPLRPRNARIKGKQEWQRVYEQHGPVLRAIARELRMSRKHITRELERYGIIPDADPYAREWEGRAA